MATTVPNLIRTCSDKMRFSIELEEAKLNLLSMSMQGIVERVDSWDVMYWDAIYLIIDQMPLKGLIPCFYIKKLKKNFKQIASFLSAWSGFA